MFTNRRALEELSPEDQRLISAADEAQAKGPIISTVVPHKSQSGGNTYCFWSAPAMPEADRQRHIMYHNHRYAVRKQVLLLRSYYASSNWNDPKHHKWVAGQAGRVEDEIARLWNSRPTYMLSVRANELTVRSPRAARARLEMREAAMSVAAE